MRCWKKEQLWLLIVFVGGAVFGFRNPGQAAADSFRNLNFEWAVIGTPVDFQLPASEALPYWTNNNCYPGYVAYDTVALGSQAISIHDGLDPYDTGFVMYRPIQGRYSIILQNSYWGTHAWISQTGDVPGDAHSLLFKSEFGGVGLAVSLNGTAIPMSVYSVGPVVNPGGGPVKTFIGDISAFSGQQNVELRFEGGCMLDEIEFSSIVVPEPASLCLLAFGAIAACVYLITRRRPAQRAKGDKSNYACF